MDLCPDTRHTLQVAEARLGEAWNANVRLCLIEDLSRGDGEKLFLRADVATEWCSAPREVFIKRSLREGERVYDADLDGRRGVTIRCFNDWAGHQFVSRLSVDAPLAPQFYAGDRATGTLILEYLPYEGKIEETLAESDAERTNALLREYALQIGRLNAASGGRTEEYRLTRARLGPHSFRDQWHNYSVPSDGLFWDTQIPRSLGIHYPAALADELEAHREAIDRPPGFFAFIHSDLSIGNNVISGGRLRLVDFDMGSCNSALLDGVCFRMGFPNNPRHVILPVELVRELETIYRTELARNFPEASDDRLYGQAFTDAAAQWMLRGLGRVPHLMHEDSRYERYASGREITLHLLRAFAETSQEFEHLRYMGDAAWQTAVRLQAMWGL